ncbi:Copia type Polyprotein [Phytophthora megakarya]|uniref:Copia type Polyprotein n=1 Tax=Phytophthora megakarya TaxID=4795 RepID=A0A225UK26_9STRA|nr:Copia type Polyprotein [Phytophthora megakarya]
MAPFRAKGVLKEVKQADMPEEANAIRTMWAYAIKTDHQGYVIRFKARIVALGNWQRPGIYFIETFAPVARMLSFRLVLAIAVELDLKLCGGDINTACLNPCLAIPLFIKSIEGFPYREKGSLRVTSIWTEVFNAVQLNRAYTSSMREIPSVKQIVGDIVMTQLKYVAEILTKYKYADANKCGNPMETKARLVATTEEEEADTRFDYRGCLGIFLYLATCRRPALAYSLGQLNIFVSKQ